MSQFKLPSMASIVENHMVPFYWKLGLRKKELEEWKTRHISHIIFFDRASKGNQGEARVGGVIIDPNGKQEFTYDWGVGITSNNQS